MRLFAVLVAAALCSAAAANKEKKAYESDFLFEEDDWKEKKEKPSVKTWIWDPESGLCSALACRSSEMCLLEDSFTAVCVSRAELKTNGDRIISRQLAEDEHLIKSEPWSDEDDEFFDEEEDDEINLDEEEEEEDEEEYDYDDEEEEEDDEGVDDDDNEDDDEEADRKMNEEVKKEKECHECPYTHPTVSAYICGTNNRTYSSLCRLEQYNCMHEKLVTTACKGFCPCKESESYQRRRQKPQEGSSSRSQKTHGSLRKSSKARLKSKYDKYQKERKSYNNVKYYPKKKNAESESKHQAKCSRSDLESMGARLADWFVVIKATNGGVKPNYKHHKYYSTHFPTSCRPMSQWMFLYLDTDADGQLTQRELYAVERDEHELCLKPFLDSCDLNSDIFLSPREWCTCFKSVAAPCEDRRRDSANRPGAYLPACDEDGFFRPTQCHGSQCWCADRYGVEQKGTRTRRGNTRCDGDTARYDDFNVADEDDEDYYVTDGSGGGPLLEF